LAALELGAVSDLIVYEDLTINRYTLRNKDTGEEKLIHLDEIQEKDAKNFKDVGPGGPFTGPDLEVKEKVALLDWFSTNFKSFGARLQFITNKSQEGAQFCKGFGGIGGLLRYQVDFATMETIDDDDAPALDFDDNDFI